jgi:hypothetical protein
VDDNAFREVGVMASQEKDDVLRVSLEKQAVAYRKLAAERAKRLKPQEPPQSS